ncbi:MAG: hypothetical protein ACRCWF_18365 [Beijerinckiaceae bacterium]
MQTGERAADGAEVFFVLRGHFRKGTKQASLALAFCLLLPCLALAAHHCKWTGGGFPYAEFEIGSKELPKTEQTPHAPVALSDFENFRRAFKTFEVGNQDAESSQQRVHPRRLNYRLKTVDSRCRLHPLGYHASAVLSCDFLQNLGTISGLMHLGNSKDTEVAAKGFAQMKGFKLHNFSTWHEQHYDLIEDRDDPIEVEIDGMRGSALYQRTYLQGRRAHDVISFAVHDGCAGLYMRLESIAADIGEAEFFVHNVALAIAFEKLNDVENREAYKRDAETYRQWEMEQAMSRSAQRPLLPSEAGVPPVGPPLPLLKRTLPLMLLPR